jgi:hypothetical protein
MILGGESLEGKTTLAAELGMCGVTRIDHDHIIGLLAKNEFGNRKEIYSHVRDHYSVSKINVLIDSIKDSELGNALVKEMCAFVPKEDRVIVLEGYAFKYKSLRIKAKAELEGRGFKVWYISSAE